MLVNVQQLKCFVAAVEAGNFTRASEKLHTAQSALSRHISNLEAELGVQLFARTARGVELSPEGVVAYERATQLLNDIRAFSRDVTSPNPRGGRVISIAAHGGIGPHFLPDIARSISRQTQGLRFRLSEGLSEQIEREVCLGECDIGLVIRRNGFRVERTDLESISLVEDMRVAIGPREDARPVGEPWSAATALRHPLVLPPGKTLERAVFENWARHHAVAPNVVGEALSVAMRIELARAVGGVCFLPGIALADLPHRDEWQVHWMEKDEYSRGIEWFIIFRRTEGDQVIRDVVDAVRRHALALFDRGIEAYPRLV